MTRRGWWAFAFMSVVWGGSYLLIKIGNQRRDTGTVRGLMRLESEQRLLD